MELTETTEVAVESSSLMVVLCSELNKWLRLAVDLSILLAMMAVVMEVPALCTTEMSRAWSLTMKINHLHKKLSSQRRDQLIQIHLQLSRKISWLTGVLTCGWKPTRTTGYKFTI